MDKAKFFKMQLNSEIVLCEMDAERMAETIRRLSAGDDPINWADDVAVTALSLAQTAGRLAALRKVAHDAEILIKEEEA